MKDVSRENNIIKLHDGRKLGYAEYGNPNGKPIFFFHGWPGSRYSGKETDAAGKKIGVRIISTDRPGIGLSDYKIDRKLLEWPDDIIELADYLKIKKFSIMGVSGGGPYVAACAYKIPNRVTKAGIIVGLAPINVKGNLDGIAFQGKVGWTNYHRFPLLRKISTFNTEIAFKYIPILLSLFFFPTKEDRIIFKSFHNNNYQDDKKNDGLKEAFRQGIKGPELELKIYTDDWGFKLKDIKTKTYLWYGAKDKCVSLNMGKYYKSQIPGSELFIDPDGRHLSRYNFEEKILKTLIV